MLFVRTTSLENIVSAGSKLLENNSKSNEILVNLKRNINTFFLLTLGIILCNVPWENQFQNKTLLLFQHVKLPHVAH